jgi:predicted DNA-binding transcriptional regulator YafY
MRCPDRLLEIIQRLRGHRVVTARSLAEQFNLGKRTIYRDIRDLTASKVPIEGAAGVG